MNNELKLAKLQALEEAGVDSWEGYEDALKDWYKLLERAQKIDNFIDEINDLLAEAEVDEPAGIDCGYAIRIDEDWLRYLVTNLLV